MQAERKQSSKDKLVVKKIFVRFGAAIDQIKFQYEDGTVWQYGVSGGQLNHTPFQLTEGEYLTEVICESLPQQWYAAGSVEFYTNKGRYHSYFPVWSFQKRNPDMLKSFKAKPGYSIVQLKIVEGTLVGISQEEIPKHHLKFNNQQDWYKLFWLDQSLQQNNSEDDDQIDQQKKILSKEFNNKRDAQKFYQQNLKNVEQILIDVKNNKILQQKGKLDTIEEILEEARNTGYYLDNYDIKFSGNYVTNILKYFKYSQLQKNEIPFMIFIILLIILANFSQGYTSIITGKFFEALTTPEYTYNKLQEDFYVSTYICQITEKYNFLKCDDNNSLKLAVIIIMVTIQCLAVTIKCLKILIQGIMKKNKMYDLRNFFFKHALDQEQGFYDQYHYEEIKDNTNPNYLVDNLCDTIPLFINNFIQIAIYFLMMAYISIQLTFCVVIIIPIYGLSVHTLLTKNLRQILLQQTRHSIVARQNKSEVIDNISTVKLFSQEKKHISICENSFHLISKLEFKKIILEIIQTFFVDMFSCLIFCLALYFGIDNILQGQYSTSDITGFFILFSQILSLFQNLSATYEDLKFNLLKVEQIQIFTNRKSKLVQGTQKITSFQKKLSFKNVFFFYPTRPNEWVLKDISFDLTPGKMLAFVGESGAGKSSISNLLMKQYDPCKGHIELDGLHLNKYSIESLHSLMTIVTQTPILFNNTIKFNIKYGINREVSDEELIEVSQQANIYQFIKNSRSGFDTTVGSFSSSQLSGGQKQRLAIARAMLMQPQILVLDEATSALDSENEKLIQESLSRLMKNKTLIVIAHRLSTVKKADEIICLKKGEIVERGSHNELLKLNGYYKSLVDKQELGEN